MTNSDGISPAELLWRYSYIPAQEDREKHGLREAVFLNLKQYGSDILRNKNNSSDDKIEVPASASAVECHDCVFRVGQSGIPSSVLLETIRLNNNNNNNNNNNSCILDKNPSKHIVQKHEMSNVMKTLKVIATRQLCDIKKARIAIHHYSLDAYGTGSFCSDGSTSQNLMMLIMKKEKHKNIGNINKEKRVQLHCCRQKLALAVLESDINCLEALIRYCDYQSIYCTINSQRFHQAHIPKHNKKKRRKRHPEN